MSITKALLEPLLASGAPRPLITHYDDASGARVELSRVTTANWAAKTANWLVDEFDVEPGSPVAVRLPAHWQTAGILLGAWWCGCQVTDEPAGAEVALVPGSAPERGQGADVVACVALDALGAPLRDLPEGVLDYVTEIRAHGDDFSPLLPIDPSTPALFESTVDDVVNAAHDRAAKLGIGKDDRVLSTLDWALPDGILDGLLSILAAQASLVQCTNPDPAKVPGRRESERTTVDLGIEGIA